MIEMFEIGDIVIIQTMAHGSLFYKRRGKIIAMSFDLLTLKFQNLRGHLVLRKEECELIKKGHDNIAI